MYAVNQQAVSVLLGWIEGDEIAIPEMQRPFVWTSTQVRDLMDSLYRGFPVGYLITWKSQVASVKGGGTAGYQQILIDGQQRTTALRAAVSGQPVMNKKFQTKRIIVSFNPQTEEFQTATPVLQKQPEWVYDISEFLQEKSVYKFLGNYLAANPDADDDKVAESLERLMAIKHAPIGIITLSEELDVETVSEIFVRINSKGVALSSADFVMSKISASGDKGRNLRKTIDYFAHLAASPHDFPLLEQDTEFADTDYWKSIKWLKDDTEDLYDPSYVDLIRVTSMVAFRRGRVSFVVRELSGLDSETRKFYPERIPEAFKRFEKALLKTVSEYEFKKFLVILKSAGFVRPSLITSINAINFAYALFLVMRTDKRPDSEITTVVRRWFVMMVLTGRASGSFETVFERDLSRIAERGAVAVLNDIEDSQLSDSFWEVGLPQRLESSSVMNPQFKAFLASQVQANAHAFLSRHATVRSMIETQGDVHHLVPKDYLRKNGFNDKREYNQVANYVYTETAVNIKIGNRTPIEYLSEVTSQLTSGEPTLGDIPSQNEFAKNLKENAIPDLLMETTADSYSQFLAERRNLIAENLREYYRSL